MNQKVMSTLLGLCFTSMTGVTQEPVNPPNFVFILVDDLGWADIKCNYAESFYDTPNIDKLAARGVLFTQAYSANPVCSPTRAAIMTGKHLNRVGITDWIPGDAPKDRPLIGPQINNELALEEITIAEKLKEANYNTYFVGKWHLGDEGFFPEDQGFDVNIGGHHRGSPPGGYYSPYKNPKLRDGPKGEYLPDRLTNEGIHIMERSKNQPFLLFLSYYTVHTPIQASKKFIDEYTQKREVLNLAEVPHQKEGDGWTKMIQEDAAYASMVTAMDENVGRLLDAIDENNLTENTWVIFTSDNGGLSTLTRKNAPTHNGPLRAGKGWCYEGGIRVPLIIAGPEIKNPGTVTDVPSISMDYYPTILSLAGIGHKDVDGENLVPVLLDEKSIKRKELMWHFPHYHGSAWKPGSAIRKGDWKLVVHYEQDKKELFNLADDPGENDNLAEKFPAKTRRLNKSLNKILKETNGLLPKENLNQQ